MPENCHESQIAAFYETLQALLSNFMSLPPECMNRLQVIIFKGIIYNIHKFGTMKVSGTFEVSINPLEFSAKGKDDIQLGRLSINKTYRGGLEAVSQGEMISAMTSIKGSAGYVAIEQVSGILDSKKGSFVLQHYGIMDKGADRLILEVVPDSGSGELKGLNGKMEITAEDENHTYSFDFAFGD
jgi:hypothetical protein